MACITRILTAAAIFDLVDVVGDDVVVVVTWVLVLEG
jgi:hypothetical protein